MGAVLGRARAPGGTAGEPHVLSDDEHDPAEDDASSAATSSGLWDPNGAPAHRGPAPTLAAAFAALGRDIRAEDGADAARTHMRVVAFNLGRDDAVGVETRAVLFHGQMFTEVYVDRGPHLRGWVYTYSHYRFSSYDAASAFGLCLRATPLPADVAPGMAIMQRADRAYEMYCRALCHAYGTSLPAAGGLP